MTITKEAARGIARAWGRKKLPAKGRVYIHAGCFTNEFLENDNGTYKLSIIGREEVTQ